MLNLLYNFTDPSMVSGRPPLRIVLADDDAQALSALRLVIDGEPGMVVTAEAADLQSLRTQLARHLPDILLLDWELRGMRPAQFLERLRELFPAMKVVALSSHPEARHSALAAGAAAFVSKGDAPERLLLTLHRLAMSAK